MQRMPSSRARQDSNPKCDDPGPGIAPHPPITGPATECNGTLYGTTADVDKVSGLTGRTVGDVKSTMKEVVNAKGEHLIEDIAGSDGAGDMRGGLVVGSRNGSMKREGRRRTPMVGAERIDQPRSLQEVPAAVKHPRPTLRPATAPSASPRNGRGQPRGAAEQPQKRSHKKGAGLAAQMAAQAAVHNDDEGSVQLWVMKMTTRTKMSLDTAIAKVSAMERW